MPGKPYVEILEPEPQTPPDFSPRRTVSGVVPLPEKKPLINTVHVDNRSTIQKSRDLEREKLQGEAIGDIAKGFGVLSIGAVVITAVVLTLGWIKTTATNFFDLFREPTRHQLIHEPGKGVRSGPAFTDTYGVEDQSDYEFTRVQAEDKWVFSRGGVSLEEGESARLTVTIDSEGKCSFLESGADFYPDEALVIDPAGNDVTLATSRRYGGKYVIESDVTSRDTDLLKQAGNGEHLLALRIDKKGEYDLGCSTPSSPLGEFTRIFVK